MEMLLQDSNLECQICFNYYSPRRRPKLLRCLHTCCSVCLTQMRLSQREILCPWCRCVTRLADGLSVSQLPDDPEIVSVIDIPHSSEHTPVFIRLPNNGCYLLPLPADADRALLPADQPPCRFVPGGQPKNVVVVTIPEERMLGFEEDQREGEAGEEEAKSSAWTGVCTVVLVAFILIFLLGIVLHNMSCVSKRFTIISCG